MAGTEAVHSGDAISQETAESISRQILEEDYGIKQTDQAEGADHAGEPAGQDTQEVADGMASPAGDTPDPLPDPDPDPQSKPAPEANAAWLNTLPESVQADLSRYNPETITYLRQQAEGAMRQDDYTRKTQETARDRAEIAKQKQLVEFAAGILNDPQKMAALYGAQAQAATAEQPPQEAADPKDQIRELMKTDDPDEFAKGLDEIIADRIQRARTSGPEAKAAIVQDAAEKIRNVIEPRLPEGAWDRAVELYNEHCQQKGINWYDVAPKELAMELRPHIRFAVAEHVARGGQSSAPQQSQGDGEMSKPAQAPGVRAAAVPSSGSGAPTREVPPHVRDGRPISEDEAFEAVKRKFGLAGEADLARLRALG